MGRQRDSCPVVCVSLRIDRGRSSLERQCGLCWSGKSRATVVGRRPLAAVTEEAPLLALDPSTRKLPDQSDHEVTLFSPLRPIWALTRDPSKPIYFFLVPFWDELRWHCKMSCKLLLMASEGFLFTSVQGPRGCEWPSKAVPPLLISTVHALLSSNRRRCYEPF